MKPREIALASIVVVLLGVALVAWVLSRQKDASGAASARNLQQWGIALNLYLIDNDNQLPEVGADPINPSQKRAWYNAMPPYLGQTPLADLPPGQRPRPGMVSLWIDPDTKVPRVWDPEMFYFNYAMNTFLQPEEGVRSFKINELEYPGNVVFLTEVDGYEPWVDPETVVFRHGGHGANAIANVLFCDGHVALVTRAVLIDSDDARRASNVASGVSWFED